MVREEKLVPLLRVCLCASLLLVGCGAEKDQAIDPPSASPPSPQPTAEPVVAPADVPAREPVAKPAPAPEPEPALEVLATEPAAVKEKTPAKPALAIYFNGASADVEKAVMDTLSAESSFRFDAVRDASKLFDYEGFIQIVAIPEYVRYDPSADDEDENSAIIFANSRPVSVPNGVRLEVTACADWPTSWDRPITIIENLVASDIHYQYYGKESGVNREVAAMMAVEKRREANRKQIGSAVTRKLRELPKFERVIVEKSGTDE